MPPAMVTVKAYSLVVDPHRQTGVALVSSVWRAARADNLVLPPAQLPALDTEMLQDIISTRIHGRLSSYTRGARRPMDRVLLVLLWC